MAKVKIPYAENVFVDKLSEVPREILHVTTLLVGRPSSPGFDAEKAYELMVAIGKTQGGRDGYHGYKVHWADDPDAPRTLANKRPADVVGKAVHIMKVLTGEADNDAPIGDGKDSAAKALGAKGGAARAKSMTPERRAEIARKAAAIRWGR